MLAVSNGRLVALSTPFGRRGWFWSEWDQGGNAWHRERVPAELVPRIAPAFLARERERKGDRWFTQEYGCEFLESEGQLFLFDDIAAALSPDVLPLYAERLFA